MLIPLQLSKKTPKQLPKTQIRHTHIWQKKINNSTTTKEPVKATQQMKPEVWKWIPKQKHETATKQKCIQIPQPSNTFQNQPPKKPRQFLQPSITPGSKNVVVHQRRWISKTQVHHVDLYWAWVSKSLLNATTTNTNQKPNRWNNKSHNSTSLRYPNSQPISMQTQWVSCQMPKPKKERQPKVTRPPTSTVIS